MHAMSPSPTSSTRRERKKAATRRRLAEAALNLFLERGFDQVTVAEIAEAADVAVSTLFAHFPSKEALVFDRGEERQRALVAACGSPPAAASSTRFSRTWPVRPQHRTT